MNEDKIIDLDVQRKEKLIENIRKCDSLHGNCDYLLEHNDCDDLIEYINMLQQKNKEFQQENEFYKHVIKDNYDTSQDIMYEMKEENVKLQQENKELKKTNASLQSALSLSRQKYNNDKARYRRKYKKEHNILTEFEKWIKEEIYIIENTYSQINGNYMRMQPILDTYKECLDKLQELKEGKK